MWTSIVTSSSCVGPMQYSRPCRSFKRNISSPYTVQRPVSFQISDGCTIGIAISCAPVLFISSRMIAEIFCSVRHASGIYT